VGKSRKGVCLSRRTFFSLNSNYIQRVYENMMIMVSKGWSYTEITNMPITKRDWIFTLFEEVFKPDEEEEK
jgi:hypothetical protein